ncbi:MAG: MFS transporter [Thermoplasmata archaeon]|nr:MFS transporter [Thermoplasmata archaeon]
MKKKRFQSANLLAATFMGTMDSNAMVPVIALYAVYLGATDELFIGIIVAMYSIIHIPANIIFGRLADKIGLRNPFIIGLTWDAVSVFLYSMAADPFQLLLVRMSHGLGGGFVGPSSMGIASRMAPEERKGRMMAKYGMALALSVIVGFAIGGMVIGRFGYQAFFYVLSAMLFVAIVFAVRVKEPEGFQRVKSRFSEDMRDFIALLKRKAVLLSYSSIFSLYFVMGAFTVLVPLYMGSLGMGTTDVVIAFSTFAILSVVIHYPSGILCDKIGAKVPALAGLIAITIAMLMIPYFNTLLTLLPVMAIFGLGHGLVFPSSSTMIVRGTKKEVRGMASGVFYALLVAGVAVGAPIAGFISGVSSYGLGMQSAAIVSIMGAVLLIALRKTEMSC